MLEFDLETLKKAMCFILHCEIAHTAKPHHHTKSGHEWSTFLLSSTEDIWWLFGSEKLNLSNVGEGLIHGYFQTKTIRRSTSKLDTWTRFVVNWFAEPLRVQTLDFSFMLLQYLWAKKYTNLSNRIPRLYSSFFFSLPKNFHVRLSDWWLQSGARHWTISTFLTFLE